MSTAFFFEIVLNFFGEFLKTFKINDNSNLNLQQLFIIKSLKIMELRNFIKTIIVEYFNENIDGEIQLKIDERAKKNNE